tara:strand:+ start:215 stop:742 length:528 start_codon:yes stop_codon:yes gene_type:complete
MKGLFLDRDGIINIEKNYVHKIEDFIFMDSIFDLCKAAMKKDYNIFVITNQAGIGRGLYTEDDFLILSDWMTKKFLDEGIVLKKIYFCPFHPKHGIGKYKKNSNDRKPNPGMILKAKEEYKIDLKKSVLVGDKMSDIEAGIASGIKKNILLSHEKTRNYADFYYIENLRDVIKFL